MTPALEKAFGYQGDNMNLPARDLVAALPFYETVLGFRVIFTGDVGSSFFTAIRFSTAQNVQRLVTAA